VVSNLVDAVVSGGVDVALTCGLVPELAGIAAEVTCTEPLVIGLRPVTPHQLVPFTLQWNPSRVHALAVAQFVCLVLTADLLPGCHTQPDHLRRIERKD
jgi:hypothetical protein